jgi:hypothetical protein
VALSPNVDRFLRNSVRSVWDLELLLFLRREKARSWTADELIHELRASLPIVTDALSMLQKTGFVNETAKGEYRFWPASPELDRTANELADAYANFPAAVTEAIWSAPNAKIRTFADAFKIKKD